MEINLVEIITIVERVKQQMVLCKTCNEIYVIIGDSNLYFLINLFKN